MDDDRAKIRRWLLAMFLPGEPDAALRDDVSLRDQGVLDSMRRIKLVAFLEDRFGISVEREDLRGDAFETVDSLVAFVARKRG